MNRRDFSLSACAGLLAFSTSSQAQSFPTRPIKLIVPTPAGSTSDMAVRVFAHELTQVMGQSAIVDNRPGANGITGTIAALNSPPDGYTMFYVNVGTLAINPYLFPKQKHDPLQDSALIGLSFSTANVLVVRPGLSVKTVAELIAYAKANPGKLSMGSGGTGTTGHLSGELFKSMAGIDAVHVPYKGSVAAYTDLVAGRVDFMFDNLLSVGPYTQDGRVRLLAVTSLQRSDLYPGTPTLDEAGLKGYETVSWGGYAVSKATPPAVVRALKQAFVKANASAGSMAFFRQTGAKPIAPMSDEQLVQFVKSEQVKWSQLVKASGADNS